MKKRNMLPEDLNLDGEEYRVGDNFPMVDIGNTSDEMVSFSDKLNAFMEVLWKKKGRKNL